MPFRSEAQRRYLWANEPEIAKRWTREHGSKPVKDPSPAAIKRRLANQSPLTAERQSRTDGPSRVARSLPMRPLPGRTEPVRGKRLVKYNGRKHGTDIQSKLQGAVRRRLLGS